MVANVISIDHTQIKPIRNRTKKGDRSYICKGSYRNLLGCYFDATDEQRIKGETFYEDARDWALYIGERLGYSHSKAIKVGAGIISVLSPRLDWDTNKLAAKEFADKGKTNRQTNCNNDKALLVSEGKEAMDIMGRDSHKTKAFYQAIVNPLGNNEVWGLAGYGNKSTHLAVIDRHAGGAYIGKPLQEFQRSQITHWRINRRISNAYFKGANELNIPVNVFQAIIWNVFRDIYYKKKPYAIRKRNKRK